MKTATASQILFRCFRRGERMTKSDRIEERLYKSFWHLLIAGVGIYELRTHKTKAAKFLAYGLIAFHIDAAVADALDTVPMSRRILELVHPDDNPR